ncbi:hypothetical protein HanXRQr2_Chr15g0712981 [Helianthus annuus]|uniref:Uncharacterized protein n=1 Tax=Helianthus annuus TaxID=4232 RepID=A0A9K3E3H2_HELAN|nr:hypothetical protein HanXRQr2_Chr15g0712981 [Helianthus annuus]
MFAAENSPFLLCSCKVNDTRLPLLMLSCSVSSTPKSRRLPGNRFPSLLPNNRNSPSVSRLIALSFA